MPVNPIWLSTDRVESYAQIRLQPITLNSLLDLGLQNNILASARLVHAELPGRLARRVRAIQQLPFIVGVNPYIKNVYKMYNDSFEILSQYPEIKDEADVRNYTTQLRALVASHEHVIPNLARGFMECKKYMSTNEINAFLDAMIHSRIGIRVLAEHHLALQERLPNWIGIVNTTCSPVAVVRATAEKCETLCEMNYGSSPEYLVNGHVQTTFAYIRVHLEYVLLELLKNAFRATVEHSDRIGRAEHPPVEVTVSASDRECVIRIRDEGGGITAKNLRRIWEYSYTTVERYDEAHDSVLGMQSHMAMQQGSGGPMAGLGFGLPISRIYSRYFGGSLDIVSITGHGCDVFLKLPNISRIVDKVSI
ncbi:hypothetical protein CXG81DRAFT_10094 [Caulochytrium protostelioides]|uniref:Protein-serine/threonine kinase n=1 Tax=Caulochytrium protostelioides TaxID=1555241 RepID=A0A4P9XCQ8_9FUNG|nr:hypothetical protein CXG81DRAFT_10094 [Caulochytrium protostelioides]|eukprot:RKP02960.1 hypothetical protein CXG81DRAFT_10094 [Caulochytrium protostelioides]